MSNDKGAPAPKFNHRQADIQQEKWDGAERRRQVRESQGISRGECVMWITLGAANILAAAMLVFYTVKLI